MFCPNCGTVYLPVRISSASTALESVLPAVGNAPGIAAAAAGAPPLPMPAPPPPMPLSAYQAAVQQPVYYVSYQAAALAHSVHRTNVLQSLRGRIQSLASTENLEGFSLQAMFSDVFTRRSADDLEDYIGVGTSRTTPSIELVDTGWPKPWLFFRVLAALMVAYLALVFIYLGTNNTNCVPGIMFLGAFAVPLATLTLLFEMNTPRNVSLHVVVKLFLFGAIASLGVALLGYALPIFDISDMEAGIVEEVAKLITVVVVMRTARYPYILNGILFGATVGAGFACFETAGYALNMGLLPGLSNT